MAITRQKKEELVAQYKELIADSSVLVFTDYKGAKVSQANSLRVENERYRRELRRRQE